MTIHVWVSNKLSIMTSNTAKPIACTLTSKEVQIRKATIIAELKNKIIERHDLPNSYSYKFNGDDESIDRHISFIKSERQCCSFFTFNLSISDDFAILELTGPEVAKDFVESEIGRGCKINCVRVGRSSQL